MGLKHLAVGITLGVAVLCLLAKDGSTPQSSAVTARPVSRASLPNAPTPLQKIPSHEPRLKPGGSNEASPRNSNRLRTILAESIRQARLVIPTEMELSNFEELMLITLQQQTPLIELEEMWHQLGWEFETFRIGNAHVAAIREPSRRLQGRGLYVFRIQSDSNTVLQAPHRFYDTGTGLLTRKLFEEHNVLAAMWNTVHRSQVDLAHYEDHYINAMTRALIRLREPIVVAQLHGFDGDKRAAAARSASMILSDTTRYPGPLVRRVAQQQKLVLGAADVRLFPIEVSELGGTQNRQAREFHANGSEGFLHFEIGRQLRETLNSNRAVRGSFFSALTTATASWDQRRHQ